MTLEIIFEQIASKYYSADTVQLLSQFTTLKQLDAALSNSFTYINDQLNFIKQNNYVFIAEHNYMTINNQEIKIEDLEDFINNKINSEKRNVVTDYLEKAIQVLEEYKEKQLIANVINWFDNFLHETDVHFTQTSDTHEMFVDMFLSQLNSGKPENYRNLNQELVAKLRTLWDEIFNLVHALDDQPSYVFESYSQEDIYIVYQSTVNENHFIKLKGTYSSYEGEILTRVLVTSPKTKTVIYY